MSIGRAAGSALRKLPKLLGRLLSKPGRLGEDFLGGITGRGTRRGVGVSSGGPVGAGQAQHPMMGKALAGPTNATKLKYSSVDRNAGENSMDTLNGLGRGGQAMGYGIGYGGAGTLAYNMNKGDGSGPQVDAGGVKTPDANEEMVKFREKFQKEKLGGSNVFSGAKYSALRGQSKWVDTAIKSIGKEKYMKMRTAVMNGDLPPEKLHSFLTDSIAHDTEALKLAGKDPYVLPGIAKTGGGESRVIVMAPMTGKDKKTSYKAMQYGIDSE